MSSPSVDVFDLKPLKFIAVSFSRSEQMRRLFIIALVCINLLSFTGCSRRGSGQSLTRFIPVDSFAVLLVNWTVASKDEQLNKIVKGREIEKILAELNIQSDAIAELAMFSDGQSSTAGNSGMLLRGSYKSHDVTEGLKNKGWTEQVSEGSKFYMNPTDNTCLSALNSNLIVFGTRAGVEAAIRATASPRTSFAANNSYKKLTSNLTGRQETYPVLMMVAFSQSSQDKAETALQVTSILTDLAGIGILGELLNKIGYMRGLACTISRKDNSFPVEFVAIMKDESSATFVSGALNLLKDLIGIAPQGSLPPSDQEMVQNLKSISIQRKREVLSIRAVLAARALMAGHLYP